MSQVSNYAQLLRPVGQVLETLKVESFSMTIASTGVHVIAQKKAEKQSPEPELSMRVAWQSLRRQKAELARGPEATSGVLELHYSRSDIERIDTEEQSKRRGKGAGSEAHSLPEILRALGGYVDQKGGQVLAVKKDDQDVTIEYESALRKNIVEQFTVASLYDYWVKMYMHRKQRT
ncbi:MAG: hypothetical protein QOF64_966 [Candidatus Binatota bacterium]|jgi:hypothetical protein|nr:hypothetical protein [Candidatus Binatota bacterium]